MPRQIAHSNVQNFRGAFKGLYSFLKRGAGSESLTVFLSKLGHGWYIAGIWLVHSGCFTSPGFDALAK